MADEPVPEEVEETSETEESKEELTEEQQALEDVLPDIKGDLIQNPSLEETEESDENPEDEETQTEETDVEAETTTPSENEVEVPKQSEALVTGPEKDEAGSYSPPVTDPGEFKPGNYSFEVKTSDGKTHKISVPEDADALASKLDEDSSLLTPSQFMALIRKTELMEQSIASDRRIYDRAKETHETQIAQQQKREQELKQWQSEVTYLRQKGELPPITPELNSADWRDPKIASESGVKETLELFKWMRQENESRQAAGMSPDMSLISAYNAMQLDKIRNADKEVTDRSKSASRTRGATIAGKSPSISSNVPKGSIVGTPRGLNDLITEAYYNQE